MTADFHNAMRSTGIDTLTTIPADGKLHRFDIIGDKPKSRNGWAVLHDDPPAGAFGCWKRGINETWTGKAYQTMSAEEKSRYRANTETARREREAEQKRIHAECRKKAKQIWEASKPAPADHPYLQRKNIKPHGAKVDDVGRLIVPVRGTDGTLHGLQFIGEDGDKMFLPGTAKTGSYFSIGGKPVDVLYMAEGFATSATIHEATGKPVAIAFDAGNLKPAAEALRTKFPDIQLVVCADDDHAKPVNRGIIDATAAAKAVNGLLAIPDFSGAERNAKDNDFNDLARLVGMDAVKRCIEAATSSTKTDSSEADNIPSRFKVVEIADFLGMDFPPREMLLSPIIPEQGLCMVYAPRGLGKTHFSLGVAYAVASGSTFMQWIATVPRGVLFLDGEMPARTLQERLAAIALSHDKEPMAPLRIITPDLQPRGMIDLSRPDDQTELIPFLDGISLIVVDNLSTLCQGGKENEGEGWLPVQQWALQQRASGRSVLFIHHSGKNGEQRGTSRREDVLDTVLALRRPGDYTPDKGATFEVHFEKARGLFGDETKPFEASLVTTPDGRQQWAMQPLEESTAEKVAKLLNEGIPQTEIAELLGVTKGCVSKAKNKARELGLLKVS